MAIDLALALCEACPAEMISALAGALATMQGLNDERPGSFEAFSFTKT